jgi:hypothetical protein
VVGWRLLSNKTQTTKDTKGTKGFFCSPAPSFSEIPPPELIEGRHPII